MGSKSGLYAPCPPLPNVQELVRTDPFQVPETYIRKEEDIAKDADLCPHLSSEVPIIDFSLLSKGHKEELKKLDQACKEWGFFQVFHQAPSMQYLKSSKNFKLM